LNFLADENVDSSIVYVLRDEGHAVLYVAEMERGIDDERVIDLANSTRSILLTEDKDFGVLVYRQKKVTGGIVLIRLAALSSDAKAEIVKTSFRAHSAKLENAFSVVSPGFMRIRNL